ncbi:hypothetical protein ACFRU3_48545 [Streptomyces sp. NPDC056910]|uniref:hypothetical protein n=1 Tax=Streptomyces sp. NPDC056910 TaxID=3345964 RepID=UPI0036799C62
MTTEPEWGPVEQADVRATRTAIEAYLNRADSASEQQLGGAQAAGLGGSSALAGDGGAAARGDRCIDDATAERIAREAWDAVQAVTPPPPDPETDAGPAQNRKEPKEVAERRQQAVAVVRGLQQLGYHLDEKLLPGPDMAAG